MALGTRCQDQPHPRMEPVSSELELETAKEILAADHPL
jgi:hypothetical protein